MKKWYEFFVLLTLGILLLSACGGAPNAQSQNPLVIPESEIYPSDFPTVVNETTGFYGRIVYPDGDGWWCFWQCMYPDESISVSSDGKWIRRKFPEVLREGTSSIDDFVFGARASVEYAGLNPDLVTRNGNVVTWPNLGIPTGLYMKQYGIRPELVVDGGIEARVAISRFGVIDVSDVKLDQDVINPRVGKVIPVDWQFAIVDPSARARGSFNFKAFPETQMVSEGDYVRFLRGQYQSDIDLYYANLEKQAGKPAPTPVLAPDNPKVGELKDGQWFRGHPLSYTGIPNTHCMKRCFGELWGQTLVRVDDANGIYFAKVLRESEVPNAVAVWQATLESKGMSPALVTVETYGEFRLVWTPDMGVPWDYYWGTQVWNRDLYKFWAGKGVDAYQMLLERGFAFRGDIGVHQLVVRINEAGDIIDVTVVDFDNLVVRDPATGKFGTIADLPDVYMQTVREEFMSDLGLPMATPIAPPVPVVPANPGVEAPKTTTVRLLSTVDDTVYELALTSEELVVLRGGGDEAALMLVQKGMPTPPSSVFVKGIRFVGKGIVTALEVVGYVWMAYEVSETMIDVAGQGETYQINPSTDTLPLEILVQGTPGYDDFQWLMANGFGESVPFNVYKTTLNEIYGGAISNTVTSVGCRRPRLEDPWVQSFPGMPDMDSPTPIQECANPDTVFIRNLQTGEESIWTSNGGIWNWVSGPACTTFATPAYNGVGDEVIVPIKMCVDASGVVTYKPDWVR